jgi:hypothetical protein
MSEILISILLVLIPTSNATSIQTGIIDNGRASQLTLSTTAEYK